MTGWERVPAVGEPVADILNLGLSALDDGT
jgi:hypothetical protein